MRAVVTGHSRGLGHGIAAELLGRGIPVLGVSRRRNPALAASAGARLTEVTLDLSDEDAVQAWLAAGALRDFVAGSALPMLVNNAGLLQPIGPLESQDPAAVWRAVAVNVGATLTLSAAFVRATESAPERRILQISSGAGRKPYAGWAVYCATKAALDHHTRCVVLDRTPRLRVCSLAPGVIDTDMQAEIRASTDERFPDRERFVAMKREGALRSVERVSALCVELLLDSRFGDEPIAELTR
jgi:benzil reductase ((S)-benzoin forming)